jgi:hypothetical protein
MGDGNDVKLLVIFFLYVYFKNQQHFGISGFDA